MRLRTQAGLAAVGLATLALARPVGTERPTIVRAEAPQATVLASTTVVVVTLPPAPPSAAQSTTVPPAPTTTTTVAPTTSTTERSPPTTSAPEPEPATPNVTEPEPESSPEPKATSMTERTVEPDVSVAQPGGGWEDLRQCESGGDYSAIERGGPGRGAYQFDQGTWDGVVRRMGRPDLVGTNPADASASAQDAAALQLYSERGSQPWPYCGRYV